MSTKIIENFNQLCYTVCFVFFTASAAKNRTIRPQTKPVNTQFQKKLQNFCNCLYLNNFKFIKFYIFTRCTESSKIIALQLCSYLPHSDAISLYIAGALVLSTLTIYTFFNKTIINLKLSYYEQPTNPTKI